MRLTTLLIVANLIVLALLFAAPVAKAQSNCITYYDQSTGQFCQVCYRPGGGTTVNCY